MTIKGRLPTDTSSSFSLEKKKSRPMKGLCYVVLLGDENELEVMGVEIAQDLVLDAPQVLDVVFGEPVKGLLAELFHCLGQWFLEVGSLAGEMNVGASSILGVRSSADEFLLFQEVDNAGNGELVPARPLGDLGMIEAVLFPQATENGPLLRGDAQPGIVQGAIERRLEMHGCADDQVVGGLVQGEGVMEFAHKKAVGTAAFQGGVCNELLVRGLRFAV